ncbi:MAG: 50S ribosomal protein L25 [Candidatus Peribacteraceae bacterium]
MTTISLVATARTEGVSAKDLRHQKKVPCVLYGNEVENTSLCCEYSAIFKAYQTAGMSTLVELNIDGRTVPTLFHDVALEPVSGSIHHVDFYAVNMKKEVEAEVPIRLEGQAPAVKDIGGILVAAHDHVTVRCLPSALPHDIPVSIAGLAEFGATLTVADLSVPAGVTVDDDPEMVIVTVQEPRAEEVVEAAPIAEGVEAAAGAEGAEAAAGAEGSTEEDKKS